MLASATHARTAVFEGLATQVLLRSYSTATALEAEP